MRQPKTLTAYVHWLRWQWKREAAAGPDGWCAVGPDGFYRSPLRCAISQLADRDVAVLLVNLAVTPGPAEDVAATVGINPPWARRIVLQAALESVWNGFRLRPR